MRFRPRGALSLCGRRVLSRACCLRGARGRGEFERVAAAHESIRVRPDVLAAAARRAHGEGRGDEGARNAMPQPRLRLIRLPEDLFGLGSLAKAPCGPGRSSKRCGGRRLAIMGARRRRPATRSWTHLAAATTRGRSRRADGHRDDGVVRRGTPGLTWGPRATDGAPTGSLRHRRRPRLCQRSTHRNPGSSRPDHRGGRRDSAGSRGRHLRWINPKATEGTCTSRNGHRAGCSERTGLDGNVPRDPTVRQADSAEVTCCCCRTAMRR